jgi:glycosyltransferase involved in cell wall biosynthesis
MRILHVSRSAGIGGAGIAAFRIHQSQLHCDVKSTYFTEITDFYDKDIISPKSNKERALVLTRPHLLKPLNKVINRGSSQQISYGLLRNYKLNEKLLGQFDLINLHWVADEMISFAQLSSIKIPIVWTLHDYWPILGFEHYPYYKLQKSGGNLRSEVIDRIHDRRRVAKLRIISKSKIHLVCPSDNMMQKINTDLQTYNIEGTVINNPLDTERSWIGICKSTARQILGIDEDKYVILYAAIGGNADFRKGFDLLEPAVERLRSERTDMVLLTMGGRTCPQSYASDQVNLGYKSDTEALRLIYSAADVHVIPSRDETFGQTALEAHSCGTPVLAFSGTGTSEIVVNGETGILCIERSSASLYTALTKNEHFFKNEMVSHKCRERSLKFSYEKVGFDYYNLYKKILNERT